MNPSPTVVVKKGGFFSALVTGLFTFLTVSVVCATGLGIIALKTFNPERFAELGRKLLADPPQWAEILPPALADAISDRRAFEYAENVEVQVSLRRSEGHDRYADLVVEVHNSGPETVSLLAMNVRLEDHEGVPERQLVAYAATPIAIDRGEWFGPLMPGVTRKFERTVWTEGHDLEGLRAVAELSDLRVFVARECALASAAREPRSGAATQSGPLGDERHEGAEEEGQVEVP